MEKALREEGLSSMKWLNWPPLEDGMNVRHTAIDLSSVTSVDVRKPWMIETKWQHQVGMVNIKGHWSEDVVKVSWSIFDTCVEAGQHSEMSPGIGIRISEFQFLLLHKPLGWLLPNFITSVESIKKKPKDWLGNEGWEMINSYSKARSFWLWKPCFFYYSMITSNTGRILVSTVL